MTTSNVSELAQKISDAIDATNDLIDEVPNGCRERTYPVILEILIRGIAKNAAGANAITDLGSAGTPTTDLLNRSLNEVFANVRPKSSTDRALLIACCIEGRGEVVTVAGLKGGFLEARMPAVSNMAGTVSGLLKRGHLMIVNQSGPAREYSVTVDGREFINELVESAVLKDS